VIDRINGHGGSAILIERLAGIGIHIKTREIAARDVKVHAASLGEDQRCGIQLNLESIDVARNHEGWLFERVSVLARTMLSAMLSSTPSGKSLLGG
jgi:hypothetical protein